MNNNFYQVKNNTHKWKNSTDTNFMN